MYQLYTATQPFDFSIEIYIFIGYFLLSIDYTFYTFTNEKIYKINVENRDRNIQTLTSI